jgi:hypothetical protein
MKDKKFVLELVKKYFNKVVDNHYKITNCLGNEFYCFEFIAKGYAMLEVERGNFTKEKKNKYFKLIREL